MLCTGVYTNVPANKEWPLGLHGIKYRLMSCPSPIHAYIIQSAPLQAWLMVKLGCVGPVFWCAGLLSAVNTFWAGELPRTSPRQGLVVYIYLPSPPLPPQRDLFQACCRHDMMSPALPRSSTESNGRLTIRILLAPNVLLGVRSGNSTSSTRCKLLVCPCWAASGFSQSRPGARDEQSGRSRQCQRSPPGETCVY